MPRATPSILALITTVVVAGACGSGATSVTQTGSIALSLTPTSATIQQGGSTMVTGTVTRTDFTGDIVISVAGAPAGVTAAVTLAPVSGGSTAQVTISASSSTAVGTYPLQVTAKGNGIDNATAAFTLTVAAATPASYTLAVATPSQPIAQGGTASSALTFARTAFTGNISLTAENLPAGVTAAFGTNPVGGATSSVNFTATSTAVPGTYNTIVIRGTAAGLSDVTAGVTLTVTVTGSFTIATGAPSLTVVQGNSVPTTLNATRVGGFAGTFAYTITGPSGAALPVGLTAVVAPTATADQNTLTVTTAVGLAPGSYPIVVHATSFGLEQTANVNVVVTGGFTIAAGTGSVSLVPGSNTSTTLNATRIGGFGGTLAYTVTGPSGAALPTGLTAAVAPTGTADQNTLTVTAAAGLAVATYPIVVHATSQGLEQTANVSVVVAAGATVRLDYSQCTANYKPIWFAYQDGTGAFTRVAGSGDVYTFNIASAKGAYAVVNQIGTIPFTTVQYFAKSEAATQVTGCAVATGKTLNMTVLGLSSGDGANVSIGGAQGGVSQFFSMPQLFPVAAGAQDLVAYRYNQTTGPANDRLVIRRDLNLPDGSSLPPINFATDADVLTPVTATITVTGVAPVAGLAQEQYYLTGAACTVHELYYTTGLPVAPFSAYGVPAGSQRSSDFHSLWVAELNATGNREITTTFHTLTNRTIALPGVVTPAIAFLGNAQSSYRMLAANIAAFPADYQATTFTYYDAADNHYVINQTAGYIGGAASVSMTAVDFSGVAGFNAAWGPAINSTYGYIVTAAGASGAACTEGATTTSAAITGTIGNALRAPRRF